MKLPLPIFKWSVLGYFSILVSQIQPVWGQQIIPADDGTMTVVTQEGDQFTINGGTFSEDGENLFHSFQEFNLDLEQIASFIANPEINNIFSRVVGGNPSILNGLIEVVDGNSNLFLMNPSGIVFGNNASLSVPRDFTATTATGIGFANGWFNAVGENDYNSLEGNPTALVFDEANPGTIVNGADLSVTAGNKLVFVGGSILSTGSMNAPGGQVIAQTVPGENLVRISSPGSLLSLEIETDGLPRENPSGDVAISILSLPELLTGREEQTGLRVTDNGQLELTDTGILVTVENGTVLIAGVISTSDQSGSRIDILTENPVLVNAKVNAGDGSLNINNTANIFGNLSLNAGQINTSDLVAAQDIGSNITIAAQEDISVGNIKTRGGDLGIDSATGSIVTGDLNTSANSGGDIALSASQVIGTGTIDSSGTDGPGGNLSLNAEVINPPQSINTDGSGNNIDGIVDIGTQLPDSGSNPGNAVDVPGDGDSGDSGNGTSGNDTTDGEVTDSSTDAIDSTGDDTTTDVVDNDNSADTTDGEVADSSTDVDSVGDDTTTDSVDNGSSADTTDGEVADSSTDVIDNGDNGNTTDSTDGEVTDSSTDVVDSVGDDTTTDSVDNGNTTDTTDGEVTDTTTDSVDNGNNGNTTDSTDGEVTDSYTDVVDNADNGNSNDSNGEQVTDSSTDVVDNGQNPENYGGESPVNGDSNQAIPSESDTNSDLPSSPASNDEENPGDSETDTTIVESGDVNSEESTVTNSSSDGDSDSASQESPENEFEQTASVQSHRETAESVDISAETIAIEARLTNMIADYLGVKAQTLPDPINQGVEILSNIEAETNIKSALLYVSFVNSAEKSHRLSSTKELELVLVTASGEEIRYVVEGATREKVINAAKGLRSHIADIHNHRGYLKSAQQLYQWLIAPLEEQLKAEEINNIAFIMDEGLRSLPIAALHDGDRFIIERYSVGLMPSLSLTDTDYVDLRQTSVLAMGAEEFADKPSLPAVPVELSTIADNLWAGDSLSFLNEEFTLDNLKQARSSKPFGIIHLATHGEFRPGRPSNSYIQLWDTKLRLSQLRALKWDEPKVELLVLSACRTALGDKDAELGFAGLAVLAGVRSAMGSLWYVDDEGTLGLMTTFYEQLKQAPVKAEALRRAQLEMLNGNVRIVNGQLITSAGETIALPEGMRDLEDKNLSHPYYWSAFTMIGNPW